MPVILQLGILFHHKKEVRESFKETLNKDDLVCFELTEQELQSLEWEHEREFEFKGNMYDIVHREQDGKKHFLWCYKDDFEKELKKKITHFLAFGFDNDIQKNDNQKKLAHFFSGLYFETFSLKIECLALSIKKVIPTSFKLINTHLSPIEPPPKTS